MEEKISKTVDPSLYDRNYFFSHCEGYNEFREGRMSSRLQKVLVFFSGASRLRILDVGCGRGELVHYLAREGHECDGIDYSKDAVEIARESAKANLSEAQLGNCRFHHMDAKQMEFDNDAFDTALMLDVVEHLYPWELKRSLEEIGRVLKPGGRLIIHTVPNKWVIKPARLAMRILRIPSEEARHVNEQSIFSLRKTVSSYYSGRIWIEREKEFWSFWAKSSGRVQNRLIARSLRAFDTVLDNQIVSPVIALPPFIFLFGTDIWADLIVREQDAK